MTDTRKALLASVGSLLLTCSLFASWALAAEPRTVGVCVGEYTRTTIWVGQPASQRLFGIFDPAARWRPFLGGAAEYEARYGAGSLTGKGTVVGERYNQGIVEAVLLGPGNPCNLPLGYQLTRVDREDLVMAAIGRASFYDAWVVPRYVLLTSGGGGGGTPACPTCPTCPQSKPCPPPPPPACLEVYVPAQRVMHRPGLSSTGVAFTVRYEVIPKECPP